MIELKAKKSSTKRPIKKTKNKKKDRNEKQDIINCI
jgi:hypothetical protein